MLLIGLCTLLVAAPSYGGTDEPTTRAADRSTVVSALPALSERLQDELVYRVDAGDVLVFALPAEADSVAVVRYRLARAPALSWLVDRSFFWRTLPEARGEHRVLVDATYADGRTDTLVIRIFVQ